MVQNENGDIIFFFFFFFPQASFKKLASTEAQSFSKTHYLWHNLLLEIIRCIFEKQNQDYEILCIIQNGELGIGQNFST